MAARSLREKAVLGILGVVLAFAALAGYWFTKGRLAYDAAKKQLATKRAAFAREEKMIGERELWDERYETEASQIPVVEDGQGSDTVWMRIVGDVAKKNNVFVSDIKAGRRMESIGNMDEVNLDVKWTGALESLVKFIYELENSDAGKFDVSALNFSPGKRQGYLGGSMTLKCVFKR